jgi:nucleotide-binding universal stress UspA family protein
MLVATDLTDRSECALATALELQRQCGSALTLIHVIAAGLPASLAGRWRREVETYLADRLAKVGGQSRAVDRVVVTGDPYNAILCEAASRSADLIVVGEPNKHRLAGLFVGTTAERVIRFSDRPILLAKQAQPAPYGRVLAAFDLSEGAVRALATARVTAPAAEFRVVHASWPPRVGSSEREAAAETIRAETARLRAALEHAARDVLGANAAQRPQLRIDMIEDNPYAVMRSEMGWPDLLVMGAHSKGRMATTTAIGRLARHLLAEAPCDVLVSRP